MKNDFKNKMCKKLYDLKAEVLESLIVENNDFRDAIADIGVKDLADIASNDIDVQLLETVGIKDKIRLQRIEAALIRLENGRFGICTSCHAKIGQAWLEAIPYVMLCINCQSMLERKGQ